VRKVPLVVVVEPKQPVALNKTCRYCKHCDLLMARQAEVEALLVVALEKTCPHVIGHPYTVIGTLDREDWRDGSRARCPAAEIFRRTHVFEDFLHFGYEPGGWGPA